MLAVDLAQRVEHRRGGRKRLDHDIALAACSSCALLGEPARDLLERLCDTALGLGLGELGIAQLV